MASATNFEEVNSSENFHSVHQDVLEQWDALAEREQHKEYAITDFLTPAQDWREVHADSFYGIVGDYDIDRSIVSHTFAIFDRYFSRGLVARGEWSLALTTCFFLAIKINSSYNGRMLCVGTIVHESNDQFTYDQILNMERRICEDFNWYLNPPVPDSFVDIISSLLLSEQVNQYIDTEMYIPLIMREELLQQSKYLCEISVMDRNFVIIKPSSIACAAVLVAMDFLMHVPAGASHWFSSLPLEYDPREVNVYIHRLHLLCKEMGHHPTKVLDYSITDTASDSSMETENNVSITMNKDSPSDIKLIDEESTDGSNIMNTPASKKRKTK